MHLVVRVYLLYSGDNGVDESMPYDTHMDDDDDDDDVADVDDSAAGADVDVKTTDDVSDASLTSSPLRRADVTSSPQQQQSCLPAERTASLLCARTPTASSPHRAAASPLIPCVSNADCGR